MYDQAKIEPYETSPLFEHGQAARELVDGTVPRGYLREDDHLYRGKVDGQFVETFPFTVDAAVMERGRQRYEIFCTPCHDRVGNGNGMIVQRGYKRPPSYHIDRLRDLPVGYFYDAVSNGFGVMAGYSYQIRPEDRWAIVAYVRALQLSQYAKIGELPEEDRTALERSEGE